MTVNVSAIVLSHDEPESLARVLDQLSKQSVSPSRVLIVDTSKDQSIPTSGFEKLKLNRKTGFAAAVEAGVKHLGQDGYLWILHDDSAPEPQALENLLREIELSPSLAIVGPKQVDWNNPKLIKQLGLTLTRAGRLFSRVRGEFDQGQHDSAQDVMAVGTAGALINLEKYRALGGFDAACPPLAADVDFSIRARLSGGRVAVAPSAKISHQMLSMNGKRANGWLTGNPAKALRQAEFHLALSYANFLGFFLGWLLLIPFALLNSVLLMVRKRVGDVPAELAGAFATFIRVGKIFSSRAKIRRTTNLKLSTLSGLRASRQEVRSSNQRAKDQEVSKQLLEAHARGDNDEQAPLTASGLISSGAIWFALGLVVLNVLWFPTNFATTGTGVIPLSSNWLDIFSQAGGTNQTLGLGFEAASDPWVWVLALLSAPTFFQPSLSITLILYLATALAFTGTFRLSALVTSNNAMRITAGLSYALWPALTMSISKTSFAQVLAITALPWLVHSIARIASFGQVVPGTISSTWSQVGVSAILLAVVATSSPSLGITSMALILIVGILKPSKIIPLLFSFGITVSLFTPLILERLATNQLLTVFLDPGIKQEGSFANNWSLPFFGFGFDSFSPALFISVPVIALSLFALLTASGRKVLLLWAVAIFSLAASFVFLGFRFNFGELVSVGVDVKALLGLFGLAVILGLAHLASTSFALRTAAIVIISTIGIAPAAFSMATFPPAVSYSDGRSVPSIIQADADAKVLLRTLKIESTGDSVVAEIFQGPGIKLDQLSTSYQVSKSALSLENPEYQKLGQLVANLVSANGADVLNPLSDLGIGYILVFPKDRNFQMALDSTRGLESIGETDFGQLWKVESVVGKPAATSFDLGLGKIITLGVFAFYFLLALPTGSISKRNRKESAIFVDVEENN